VRFSRVRFFYALLKSTWSIVFWSDASDALFPTGKTLAVFGDYFAFDISGGKFGQSLFAQLLLAKSDVNCDEPT
jgi:hypothetical protein